MSATNRDPLADFSGLDEPSSDPPPQPSSPVVTPVVGSEGFDQTRKRKSSLIARETISSIVADSDDESYDVESSDEHRPKRAKTANKLGGGYKRKGGKGLLVGHHIEDARLPVYVRYYPNGAMNARVYHEDVSEGLLTQYATFFKQRGSLTFDKIKFDAELFKDDEVDIQSLSLALKKHRLEQYLTDHGIFKTRDAAATGDIVSAEHQSGSTVQNDGVIAPKEEVQEDLSSGTADTSSDMQVGFWTEHPNIPVYAFTKTFSYPDRVDLRLCYRVHRNDTNGEVLGDEDKEKRFWRYGGMVKQENIKFKDEFVKGSVEDTKVYIKSLFSSKPEKGTALEVNTPAGSLRRSSTKAEKGTTAEAKTTVEGARRASTRLSDRDPVARSGSGSLRDASQQDENMNSSSMLFPKKSVVRGTTEVDQSPPGPVKEREPSRRTNRNVRGDDQVSTIGKQDEEISRLREQVKQLEQENKDLSKTSGLEHSNPQVPGLTSRMFDGKRFDLIESGGNAGKYVQKVFEKVRCHGKYYEEWIVLEELKLDFKGWGSSEGPSIQIGEMEVYEIKKGDHRGKFVQKVGPDSMCEFDGRQYIKWTVREKINERNLRLNI